MTTTTLTEKAIAVTGLPEGFIRATVYMGYLICKAHNIENGVTEAQLENYAKLQKYLVKHNPDKDYKEVPYKLPEGNWRILGRAAELTEDDWKRVVEKVNEFDINGLAYTDYLSTSIWDTATESGHSLLKAKGLYVTNPMNRPVFPAYNKKVHTCENDIVDVRYDEHQWQSAELLTNPLILIQ